MDHIDQKTIDENNIRRLLTFLEEHDNLNASWENAADFLSYLKHGQRISFRTINRQYLTRLYSSFLEQKELPRE